MTSAKAGSADSYDVDVAILSDFRLPGGTTSSIAEEVRAQSEVGISTALIHAAGSITNYPNPWSAHIQRILDLPGVRIASPRAQLHAKVLVIRHPTVIYSTRSTFEGISADHVIIVVNHAAVDAAETWHYPVEATDARVRRLFGVEPVWAPIGPVVRQTVLDQTRRIPLRADDWVNIFRTSGEVRRRTGFIADRPVIGRHSRPQPGKWPATGKDILQAYPDSPDYQVEILGGAQVAQHKLGRVPARWNVVEFGGEDPALFLERIDFWVYMHHPDLKEAFGRAAMEALAAGCVAIMPPYLEELFGDAALYASPREVRGLVDEYYADPEKYLAQSARAQDFALAFSPEMHIRRLEALGVHAPGSPAEPIPGDVPSQPGPALLIVAQADEDVVERALGLLQEEEDRPVLRVELTDRSAGRSPEGASATAGPTLLLPSMVALQTHESAWQSHLHRSLRRVLRAHRPGQVFVVGEQVPEGLLSALAWADIPAVWVRGLAGEGLAPEPRVASCFHRVVAASELPARPADHAAPHRPPRLGQESR
ncbi:glycosyltransferase [Nesterenkonia suensis]